MAKKKKKQNIKINNKIKELMNGKPFDEGIRDIDDNILIELTMILDLKVPMLSRKEMIKALRRAWSDGNTNLRLSIIDYLEQLGVKSSKQIKKDKVSYILSILDNFEYTKEEENDILSSFIDSSYSKITKDKIKNRLNYIRHKKKIQKWEEIMNVEFNSISQMEFYHSYNFDMNQESFTKSLLTTTEPIDIKLLDKENEELIKDILEEFKENAIAKKEEEINTFLLLMLNKGHCYLKSHEIIQLIKRMPPEDDLYKIDILLDILKRIIQEINPNYRVVVENTNIYIAQDKIYTLYEKELSYTIVATYNRSYIYNLIWKEEELPIESDLNLIKQESRIQFENNINELEKELNELSYDLDLDHKVIQKYILRFVESQVSSSRSLKIKEKLKRRIHYHFLEYIKPLKEKKKKEELLANTIRDFKSLYPIARLLKREIIFHVGPTNSGKTYEALNHLEKSQTGYYLAPLRLLALEGYETLKERGVNVSLITGEEEIIDEDSTHISSTIEMMNASVEVDVAVIDEIQMINDRDRGWAWANALIGVPAKKVILTGSIDALDAITKLCEYLQEPLEVIHFERKNELKLLPSPTPMNAIKKGTAIVAFSRRDVLSLRQQLSNRYEISVVYGNLSPEVRREEARRFREGESDILIATDAISMGLNLPIKTLLFAKDNKFDGLRRRELMTTEIAQIAGRAGRYGLQEVGYIGALDKKTLETIEAKFNAPLPPIELPFSVMASLEHVMLIGEILETENLSTILNFFADNMEFEGPFIAANIDSMLEIASIVSEYDLDLKTRYYLACSPASISSPYIESMFHKYIKQLEAKEKVRYIPPRDLPKFARTNEMMLNAEDRVREISLYLWLSFKFPDFFPDTQKAIEARSRLNKFIESSLKEGNFVKYCNRCGKALDFSYKFSICDRCYAQKRRGNYNKNRKSKDKR